MQSLLALLRTSMGAAPTGAAAAATARAEALAAERRRAAVEEELRAELLAQLGALRGRSAAGAQDVTYLSSSSSSSSSGGGGGASGGGGLRGAAARAHAAATRSELAEQAAQRFQDTPMGLEDPLTGERNPDRALVTKEQTLWEARIRKTVAQKFEHFQVKNDTVKTLEDAQSRALVLTLVRAVGRRVVRAAGEGHSRGAADLLEAADVLGAMEQYLADAIKVDEGHIAAYAVADTTTSPSALMNMVDVRWMADNKAPDKYMAALSEVQKGAAMKAIIKQPGTKSSSSSSSSGGGSSSSSSGPPPPTSSGGGKGGKGGGPKGKKGP